MDTSCVDDMIKEIRALSEQISARDPMSSHAVCDFSSREEVLNMVMTGEPRAVVSEWFTDDRALVETFAEFYVYLFRTDELAAVLCAALSCDNEARCVGAARLLSACICGSRGGSEWVTNENLMSMISDALRHPIQNGFSRASEERKKLNVVVSQKRTSMMANPFKLRFSAGKNNMTISRDDVYVLQPSAQQHQQNNNNKSRSLACEESDDSSDTSSPFTLDSSLTSLRPQAVHDSGSDTDAIDNNNNGRKTFRPQSNIEDKKKHSSGNWISRHFGMLFSSKKAKEGSSDDIGIGHSRAAHERISNDNGNRENSNYDLSARSTRAHTHEFNERGSQTSRSRSATSNPSQMAAHSHKPCFLSESSCVDVCASDTDVDKKGKYNRAVRSQRSCQDLRALKKQSPVPQRLAGSNGASSNILVGSRCSMDRATLFGAIDRPPGDSTPTLTGHAEKLCSMLIHNDPGLLAQALTRCEWGMLSKIDMNEFLCGNHVVPEKSKNLKAWVDRFNQYVTMLISCARLSGEVIRSDLAVALVNIAHTMHALNNPSGVAQICVALHDTWMQNTCNMMEKSTRATLTKLLAIVPSGDKFLQCNPYHHLIKNSNGPFVPNPFVVLAQLNLISSTPLTDTSSGRTRYSLSGLSLVHAFVYDMLRAQGKNALTAYSSNIGLEQNFNRLHLAWMELESRIPMRFSTNR